MGSEIACAIIAVARRLSVKAWLQKLAAEQASPYGSFRRYLLLDCPGRFTLQRTPTRFGVTSERKTLALLRRPATSSSHNDHARCGEFCFHIHSLGGSQATLGPVDR